MSLTHENQKTFNNLWRIQWSESQVILYHNHLDEDPDWKFCKLVKEEDNNGTKYACRKCNEIVPALVVTAAFTRKLNGK